MTEVKCPDCGKGWVVDRSAAGEMLCPNCMTRIPLGEGVPGVSAPAGGAHGSSATAPAAEASTATLPLPTTEAATVCPRCKLHFFPNARPAVETVSVRKTILVVDDLQYFRRLATDALTPTFAVKTAASAGEARSLLAEGGIDLIVLDLTLAGEGGGRQFLEELRPKPCPILIFTARDESELYGEAWEELRVLGADDLVMKGMNVAESLLRKAGSLLGAPVDEEGSFG
jgi:CheY-like chemotaxis protein/DNA-directed RNA polymerase subunit RPC12/RpoP